MGDAANYAAGVAIAMISTGCNAVGLVCQKLTHRKLALMKEQQGDAYKKPRFYTQPLWLVGIVCMIAGALLSFAVFSFLGQSRASAMAAITILWNGILAAVFLGERFSAYDALVAGVIVTGAAIAVTFGASGAGSQPTTDLPSIVAALSRKIVWIAAIVVILLWGSAYYAVRKLARLGKARTQGQIRLECYLRIFLSGIMTGVTGMLASSIVKSISGGIKHDIVKETASAWQLWLMIVCLPFSLVMQLGYLNSALAQMDALEIVPPYQAGVICIGLAWGVVFLGDAETMAPEALGLFCLGCVVACCGVGLLAFKRRAVPWLDGLWAQLGWAWCLPRKGKGTHLPMQESPSSPTSPRGADSRTAESFDTADAAKVGVDGKLVSGEGADGEGADAARPANPDDDTIGLARDGSTDSIPQVDMLVPEGSTGSAGGVSVDEWGAAAAQTQPHSQAQLAPPSGRPSIVGGARSSILSIGRILFALPDPEPESQAAVFGGGNQGDGASTGSTASAPGPDAAAAAIAAGEASGISEGGATSSSTPALSATSASASASASRRSLSVFSSGSGTPLSSTGSASVSGPAGTTAVTNPLRLARMSAGVPSAAAASGAASAAASASTAAAAASGDGGSGGSAGGIRHSISASRRATLSMPLSGRAASGSIGGDASGPVSPRLAGAGGTPPAGAKMGRRMTIDDYDGLLSNEASSALAIDGGFTLLSSIGAAVSTLLADGSAARSRANSLAHGGAASGSNAGAGAGAGATAMRLPAASTGTGSGGSAGSPVRRRAASVEMMSGSAAAASGSGAGAASAAAASGAGFAGSGSSASTAVAARGRSTSGASAHSGPGSDAAAAAAAASSSGRPPRPLSGRPTDWAPPASTNSAGASNAAGAGAGAGALGAITEDGDDHDDGDHGDEETASHARRV